MSLKEVDNGSCLFGKVHIVHYSLKDIKKRKKTENVHAETEGSAESNIFFLRCDQILLRLAFFFLLMTCIEIYTFVCHHCRLLLDFFSIKWFYSVYV